MELHGRGIEATRFDALTGFGELAGARGFALALPNAINEVWNDGRPQTTKLSGGADDVGSLAALIGDAQTAAPIDPDRVSLAGMPNGAVMAGRFTCERATEIAGFAQVGGTAAAEVARDAHPSTAVPLLHVHGTADRFAPYEGGVPNAPLARLLLGRSRSPAVGVDEWARFWVEANAAAPEPTVRHLPPDTTVREWHGDTPASDVVFYRVGGAGHTWPSPRWRLPSLIFGGRTRTFDATEAIVSFLLDHTRRNKVDTPVSQTG